MVSKLAIDSFSHFGHLCACGKQEGIFPGEKGILKSFPPRSSSFSSVEGIQNYASYYDDDNDI